MPTRKVHQHNVAITLPGGAASSTSPDPTVGGAWAYLPFASKLGTVDPVVEFLDELAVGFNAAVAQVATNNFGIRVSHYDVAGSLKNRLLLSNATSGLAAFVAGVMVDLSGPVAGDLTNPTGTTLPWALVPGDYIAVEKTNNGTGEATAPGVVEAGYGVKS